MAMTARDDGVVRGDDAVGLREVHRPGHALENETAVPVTSEVVGKVVHEYPALLNPVNHGEVDVRAREDVVYRSSEAAPRPGPPRGTA